MASLLNELRNNLVTANELGDTEWAEALEKRIKEEEKVAAAEAEREAKAVEEMTKAELVAEAEARGVEVDPSAKKADILEALGSEE